MFGISPTQVPGTLGVTRWRLRRKWRLVGIFGVTLTLWSCQHSENRYLRRAVTEEEVVGLWLMNPGSVKDLRDIGYEEAVDPYEHRIVLRPDGTCHFATILLGREFVQLDVTCRWWLRDWTENRQIVDLEINVGGGGSAHAHYFFDENRLDGRLTLWNHITDPDMWRYVEYAKVLDRPIS